MAMMWKDQYDRALRSQRRVKAHYSGRSGYPHFGPEQVAEFRDDVIHAFQDLFHVRDWLKNDPAVRVLPQLIDRLYKDDSRATPNLHRARDLANGSKHLQNKHPSVGAGVAVSQTSRVTVDVSGEMTNSRFSHSIAIELGGGNVADALQVLQDGHEELAAFLAAHGLS